MGENSKARKEAANGGEPQTIGQCMECGKAYPVQRENGNLRPIGTDGACACGSTEFELSAEK